MTLRRKLLIAAHTAVSVVATAAMGSAPAHAAPIRPLADRITVRPDNAEALTGSSMVHPESALERPSSGVLEAARGETSNIPITSHIDPA
ncbi:hypothetical protein [Streptomyces lavendulae]|uniref:hypothetical protein n=1 Tax=Streptomyces lavendulae TaxID=1914 RepID=UPI0036C0F3A1